METFPTVAEMISLKKPQMTPQRLFIHPPCGVSVEATEVSLAEGGKKKMFYFSQNQWRNKIKEERYHELHSDALTISNARCYFLSTVADALLQSLPTPAVTESL